MEEFLIKYCIRCREVRPSHQKFCTICGSQLVIPPTDRLKLEAAARIMSSISLNGNGNAEILRKVQRLSMAAANIDIQMRFCGKCEAEKPPDESFCDKHGSRLTVPKTDRERLAALGWLLDQVEYCDNEDSRILLGLRRLVIGHAERPSQTAIAQPG